MTKITFPEGFWQEYIPGCFRWWSPEELEEAVDWRQEVIKKSSNSAEVKKSLFIKFSVFLFKSPPDL